MYVVFVCVGSFIIQSKSLPFLLKVLGKKMSRKWPKRERERVAHCVGGHWAYEAKTCNKWTNEWMNVYQPKKFLGPFMWLPKGFTYTHTGLWIGTKIKGREQFSKSNFKWKMHSHDRNSINYQVRLVVAMLFPFK